MIFIYETDNPFIDDIKRKYRSNLISFIGVEKTADNKLGYLRNLSIEKANGNYVMQWDDDDVYHVDRIKVQYRALKAYNTPAIMLDQRYIHMNGTIYLSNVWPFEGSILAEKSILKDLYSNKPAGEDTDVLITLLGKKSLLFVSAPHLYLYRYHGDNVFDENHFAQIVNSSTRICSSPNTRYKKLAKSLHTFKRSETASSLNSADNLLTIRNSCMNLTPHSVDSSDKVYILNTYGHNNPDEGLSVVYHAIKELGTEIVDSRRLQNKIVIVAGRPHIYVKLLSSSNYNIIYTTYEFFPLPREWVKCLNIYDLIVVPHPEIKKMFANSGVTRPINVIQQGFPVRNIKNIEKNPANFTLGFLGVPAKRKNLEMLIAAVENIKDNIPNIVLKVHISKYYSELVPIVFPDNKHFDVSYGFKSNDQIDVWYASLDCYIFPSSGEGWSFTPRESLSLKIPTIISNCLVHRDLTDFCNIIPLPVSTDNITEAVHAVHSNYDHYKKNAERGSAFVLNNNRNSDMISQFKEIISNIA